MSGSERLCFTNVLDNQRWSLDLQAVRKLLRASPFKLAGDAVSIMDGADEGAYAWLTLNYLLGKTGRESAELVGAVDLGGGSIQAAFAVDAATAKDAPDGALLRC